MRDETAYNPLDKQHLGQSVADALLARPVEPLPPGAPFVGAGIYAIYYCGGFPEYAAIAELNCEGRFEAPIYVGKAVPAGARKGGFGLNISPGMVLYNRLKQHAESVAQAHNLNIDDFFCRYLVVDDIWIPLGEALLIERFSPVWNTAIDGFGNHDPGAGRYQGKKPAWDVVHPGRPWANRLQPNPRTAQDILHRMSDLDSR